MVPGALCVSLILAFDHSDPQVKNYLINTKFLAVFYQKTRFWKERRVGYGKQKVSQTISHFLSSWP